MISEIYFTTKSGKLISSAKIATAAIINGDSIDEDNLDEIREYAKKCKGVIKEVNPSIKICLKNGDRITAIKLYYLRHPGITLSDAKKAIDDIERRIESELASNAVKKYESKNNERKTES